MNPKADDMKKRTKQFALDVLAFARSLPETDEARDIGRQLRRSGTSVGSNYRAVCRARSDEEFIARAGVALEEADESAFWLEIIDEGKISSAREIPRLLDEANQLSAILAQSRLTVIDRLNRERIIDHQPRRSPKSKI
jgi:four helix bundle protein